MTKRNMTLSLDGEVVENLKEMNINISGNVNEFLQGLVARYDDDIEGINIRLEKLKKDKLTKKLITIQAQLRHSEDNIIRYEEMQKKKEEDRLKREKDRIRKEESCWQCKSKVSPKWHPFPVGKICHACLMSSGSEQIGRWNK